MMKRVSSTLAALVLAQAATAAAGAQQPVSPTRRGASRWAVRIVQITMPAQARIASRSPYGGTNPAQPQSPSPGHTWLIVGAALTPPDTAPSVSAEAIRVSDGQGASYLLLGIDHLPGRGAPSFVLLGDSDGRGMLDTEGNLRWLIRDGTIHFERPVPERVALLFSVPRSARRLSLQVDDSGPIPIRLR